MSMRDEITRAQQEMGKLILLLDRESVPRELAASVAARLELLIAGNLRLGARIVAATRKRHQAITRLSSEGRDLVMNGLLANDTYTSIRERLHKKTGERISLAALSRTWKRLVLQGEINAVPHLVSNDQLKNR